MAKSIYDAAGTGQDREHVEVLTLMRFAEREMILPVGIASVEEDDTGRRVMVLRLAVSDRRMFVPLWDVLVLAGIEPRVVSRYLRRHPMRLAQDL